MSQEPRACFAERLSPRVDRFQDGFRIVTFTRTAFEAVSGTETKNGTAALLCGSFSTVSRREGAGIFSLPQP